MQVTDHSQFHSKNAFCGYAGEEEMRHFEWLLEQLTDEELRLLTRRVGITFTRGDEGLERYEFELVLSEADREDFYREYHKIIGTPKIRS